MDYRVDVRYYYLDVGLRRWKAVLVVLALATGAAAVVSFVQKPTHQATVTMTEQSFEFIDVQRLSSQDRTMVKLHPSRARTSGRSIQALPLHLLDSPTIAQRGVISVEALTGQRSLDSVIELLESEREIIDGAKDQLSGEVSALQLELA